MTLQQDVEILKKVPLFSKIEPAKLKLLAFTSEHLEFQPGQPLCRQGEAGDAAFIVLDGAADVVVASGQGQVKVAEIGKHDIVGEIAILCNVPRTATVQATTPLVALAGVQGRLLQSRHPVPGRGCPGHAGARPSPALTPPSG